MEKVDVLIRTLEPEIDRKCAQIKQRKSERLLTGIFIALAIILLLLPAILIFFGVSLFTIFIPIVFVSAVFLITLPVLASKGVEVYE